MSLTSLEIFKMRAGEFSAVDDDTVEKWLNLAASRMAGADRWGAVYQEAVALRAAHMMTRDGVGQVLTPGNALVSAAGAATSITTGRLAVSLGGAGGVGAGRAADGSEDDLTTTKYGLSLLELMKGRAVTVPRWA